MAEQTSGKAIASLVFAILGIAGICPCIGPILGIVLGQGERDGVGRVGYVLGWVGVALWAITIAVIGVLMLLGVGVAGLSAR